MCLLGQINEIGFCLHFFFIFQIRIFLNWYFARKKNYFYCQIMKDWHNFTTPIYPWLFIVCLTIFMTNKAVLFYLYNGKGFRWKVILLSLLLVVYAGNNLKQNRLGYTHIFEWYISNAEFIQMPKPKTLNLYRRKAQNAENWKRRWF